MSAVDLMQALEGKRLAEADAVAHGEAALDVDVAIVGEGAVVSLLAAAVARGGRSVAVVPPVVPAGGAAPGADLSTVPYSSELALLIGERFGLPEVSSLALLEHAPAELRAASGGKTSLGFVHHRPRRTQDPAETVQFQVPGEHAEWQPDRAALDAWARSLAVAKGARVLTGAAAARTTTAEGAEIRLAEGGSVTARLLVDASPAGAPAGRRTISADFESVTPYEHVVAMRRYGLPLRPWSRGTVTHTFPGGWLQVTHRGNHDLARGTGTGIALTVGPEHVVEGEAPDALLERVLAELPELRAQLAKARRATDWHDTAAAVSDPEAGTADDDP
ncbi:MAG TPA: hypothetical protein VN238_12060, partial [Solirubrobacteraceae bacterium]|nr:hypothetical protein [Solirubrobacteraceae bacterium]